MPIFGSEKLMSSDIIYGLISSVTAAVLIFGAIKRNRVCLWLWIAIDIIRIFLFIIFSLLLRLYAQ